MRLILLFRRLLRFNWAGRTCSLPRLDNSRARDWYLQEAIKQGWSTRALDRQISKLHVTGEFEDYLSCGRLENGFLRVHCHSCSYEHLVAFSCKRRGFCTSCGARRMVETAALLVDHVLPHRPVRQWVLSFPYPLRFLLASQAQAMGKVLAIVNRAISTYLINKAGFKVTEAHTGAVTLIQCFGSALNLNLHFHALFIDGVFSPKSRGELRFHRVNAPTSKELNALVATISERVARYLERRGWLSRDE